MGVQSKEKEKIAGEKKGNRDKNLELKLDGVHYYLGKYKIITMKKREEKDGAKTQIITDFV